MRRRFLALSLLLLPFPACNDAIPNDATPNDLLPTVALQDRVAFVEKNSHTAFLLDPTDKALVPRMVSVGKAPIAAVKRNGDANNQLLVLSSGDRGSAKDAPVAAQLQAIDAVASVAPVTYTLASPFDGLAQSSDGGFVVLFHASSAQSSANSALFNPNELAIVNFNPQPAGSSLPNPYAKSIRSFGGVPNDVVFSPLFTFAGKSRTLAVVLAENYVTIVDLNNPDHSEITVPLSPDGTSSFMPAQVLFDSDDPSTTANPKSYIYIRADGSNDIFQIALADLGSAPPTSSSNDFRVSLSILAAGTGPADMALYGTGTAKRLAVAASASRTLVIIDPSTSSTTSVPTSIPVNRIVRFDTTKPTVPTATTDEQALLVDVSNGSSNVLFADLHTIETSGGIALTSYPLGSSAASVVPLVDQGIAVLMLNQYGGSTALTVVDLANRTFSPIGAGGQVGATAIETRAPSRLWSIDAPYGLNYLNLVARGSQARLATSEIWLDQVITSVIPFGWPSSDKPHYLAVGQADPNNVGNVTFLDADNPDRTTARTAYGFLLTNTLERGQP
jgi:prepilin-type processing-associated H-X9-DG protein